MRSIYKELAHSGRRLDTNQAADYLGNESSTLNTWRSRGEGPPFIKVGRSVRYDTRDLDQWLAARKRRNTADQGEAA